jgi:hypothetical protein
VDIATFIWMFFVLKIPIVAACLLIWWAVREPEPAEDADDRDDGGSKQPRQPRPRKPGPPRRGGPHGAPVPRAPARVRAAKGRGARHVR